MNSSFISTIEGVHIWHSDCLWGVDYNLVFYHRFAIGVKRQGQIYLKSVYGLFRELLLHFLTKGVHTYCLWCVNIQSMLHITAMTLESKVN